MASCIQLADPSSRPGTPRSLEGPPGPDGIRGVTTCAGGRAEGSGADPGTITRFKMGARRTAASNAHIDGTTRRPTIYFPHPRTPEDPPSQLRVGSDGH